MTTESSQTNVIEQADAPSVETQVRKKGFTLTEIAIVLGIIGLILGAIWVAAAAVYNNLRLSRANTELLSITQAIRSLYATATVIDSSTGTNETTSLISAGVFPSDAVNGTSTVGPWSNSTIAVFSAPSTKGGSTADAFQVVFSNVPQAACITLATANTGTAADKGLVSTDAGSATSGGNVTASLAANYTYNQGNPLSVANAAGLCGSTNDNVGFTFKLKN